MVVGRMDGLGRNAWLMLALVALWAAWPVGVALFAFVALTGRLHLPPQSTLRGSWSNLRSKTAGFSTWANSAAGSSGNAAFDDYRKAELDRLKEEQEEFRAYIERLRRARDKAEFDQFMAERRARATQGHEQDPALRVPV